MKVRKMMISFALCILISVISFSQISAKTFKWRMASTWSRGNALIKPDLYFVKTVNEICKDELKIRFHPVGEIVGAFELFGAVQDGVVQAGGDWSGYWVGKNTAFNVLSGFPMGPSSRYISSWIYQGGGFEIYNEVYGKFGMVYLPHGIASVESGVRGNKKFMTLADYKGSKIRMSGLLQGKILKDLGAVQTNLAGEELFQAMDKGIIDAAEYSVPVIDWTVGLQNVSTQWNAPGWHQPGSIVGLMINKKAWDKLSKNLQNKLKIAAQATMAWSSSYFDYQSGLATTKFLNKNVKVNMLDDRSLDVIEQMAHKHIMVQAKENPLFAKALYSLYKTVEKLAPYRDIERSIIKRAIKPMDMEQLSKLAEK